MLRATGYAEALKEIPKPCDLAGKTIPPVRSVAIEQKAKAMALTEIEGEIAKLQAQLAQEQTTLELAKEKLNDTLKGRAELHRTIAAYGQELSELEERLAHPKPIDEPLHVIQAKRVSLRAQQETLKAELVAAEQQAELFKRQMLVAQNQQALTSRKVNRLEALIKTWEDVREHRQTYVGFVEARQATAALQRMDKETWPKSGGFLHELAANNLTMSKAIIELSDKATQANKTAKLLQARLNQLQDDFELTRKRIKVMGLSRKSGQLLQSRRGSLLTSHADSRVAENRRDEIVLASLAGDDLLQERQDFLVLKNNIYNQLDKLDTHLTREQNDMLTIQAFLLLESYRKLLEDTGEVYIEYLGILNSQEAAQKEIDALSKQYRDYINQRLFWTQSTGIISADGIKDAGKAIAWQANSSNWAKLASDFKFSINERPSISGMLLIAAAVLIFLRPRFNRQIKTIDERVGQTGEDSIGKTFAGMLLTLLQAAGILFVIYLSARCCRSPRTIHWSRRNPDPASS